jgi:energy-coupling factor transporter ATP-binding protein EcfA2
MNTIMFHTAQAEAIELSDRLCAVLRKIDDPRAEELLGRVAPTVHDKPVLVFTGQYNSGKSTLARALTGLEEIVIDSDVATDRAQEYDWDGLVRLVDTPGVQTGMTWHDEIAEEALVAADLVLFTITVELFDDAGVTHFRHIADGLGKRSQMLLLITKANTLIAEGGIRELQVREALGELAENLPIVECDARDYLDGLEEPDPQRREAYVRGSNIEAVRDAINRMSARRGQLARYVQPLQAVRALAAEAMPLLVEDPEQRTALAVLARQQAVLSTRRARMEAQISAAIADFRAASIQAGEAFADSIESIEDMDGGPRRDAVVQAFIADLNKRLTAAAERLAQDLKTILDRQFEGLTADVKEIEASPQSRVILDLGADIDTRAQDVQVSPSTPSGAHRVRTAPRWTGDAQKWLKEFQRSWGAGGGVQSSSGTVGHQVVTKVGHLFGKKFKPWEAVRTADRIGKAARYGGAFISIGTEVASAVMEERAELKRQKERDRRRRSLIQEVADQAETIGQSAAREVRSALDDVFATAYREIESVRRSILDESEQRSAALTELRAIGDAAERALQELEAAAT